LNRHSGLDHSVRVRFSLSLGERASTSGPLDELSNADGRSLGWPARVKMSDCLTAKGALKIVAELVCVHAVSEPLLGVKVLGAQKFPLSFLPSPIFAFL